MQVKVPVKVSAVEFYSLLLESLQQEVYSITKTWMDEKTLAKGYKYKKKSSDSKGNPVRVHVRELKHNYKYVVSFSTLGMSKTISYILHPEDKNTCIVEYLEESTEKEKKSIFHPEKNRAKKMIRAAEKYIVEHRK